jgi:hypothetical protein
MLLQIGGKDMVKGFRLLWIAAGVVFLLVLISRII